MTTKTEDKICVGCPKTCPWFEQSIYASLSTDQLSKMYNCPCGVCVVKSMCRRDDQLKCSIFTTHYSSRTF